MLKTRAQPPLENRTNPLRAGGGVSEASLKDNDSWKLALASLLQAFCALCDICRSVDSKGDGEPGWVGEQEEVWVPCQEPPSSRKCSVRGSALGHEGKGQVYPQVGKGKFRSCESQAGISLLVGAGRGGGDRRECGRRLTSKASVITLSCITARMVENGATATPAACDFFPRSLGL